MRILIRSAMTPLENYTAEELLKKDRFGVNVGNLVYQYSVYRLLYDEVNTLTPDGLIMDPNRADWINENFDLYVLPFADAFRPDFRKYLKLYTELFKRLKIPICILGIGMRASYEPNLQEKFVFDDDTKAFINAALEKSSMIGLRGEITAEYLTKLGYTPEKDFSVIGCPSLYTFGRNLTLREINLQENSRISLNGTQGMSQDLMDYLVSISKQFPDHFFIPQVWSEMVTGYLGGPSIAHTADSYPYSIESDFYKEGKVKFFLNAKSWFDYMKTVDFSVGSRLHGNITATINGTPSLTIASDARVRELVSYHKLPSIPLHLIDYDKPLSQYVEETDFKSPERQQEHNFDHYLDFLNTNGIETIFSKDRNRKFAPIDEVLAKINYEKPVKPIISVSDSEKINRLSFGLDWYKEKKTKEIAVEKHKNTELTKKLNTIRDLLR
ncbi:polysaccharide pyruvyl transferase family protein [Enterococcus sp. BWT-B8]|uniref:polysaccharide pyruvyl transferase family protein n=1 Tax=unclassified Enterococcus TaxID=2608891 RepID=UPI001E64D76B|nr:MULTISPECIES: polysaccharide pyruvyl transferase family protein [unclassified Enterococcus]MCB5952922.1 polysaccharide pyruvyl transferase family protein [Enterococcus sp. BWT-B8]MCB5953570.1 polysaccharide pyruvyl transferase family protein [Enterococcus sp. CWB-B31]